MPVDIERLGLPAAAIERKHQLPSQPLAQRVGGDEHLELAHHLGVAPQRQIGLDPLLERGEAKFVEPRDLGLRERLVREVGERRTTPERQADAQRLGGLCRSVVGQRPPSVIEGALEAVQVELARGDLHHVPVPAREQRSLRIAVAERLAELRHVDLDGLGGGRRRRPTPQVVDQPLARDDLVRVQQQERQERALTTPTEQDLAILRGHLEGTKDLVLHEPLRDRTSAERR